jgi:hypothetical protein
MNFKLIKGSDQNKFEQLEKKILELSLSVVQESSVEVPIQQIVNFEKSATNESAFINVIDAVNTSCSIDVNVSGIALHIENNSPVVMPELVVGTDYAIYATADGLVASDNFTFPNDYTAENSRRIGGFHYGDNFIYPRSFWDLKFKPTCDDPRGMVRSFQGFWADIYLLNTTPDLLGTSAYNAQIADGASCPKKPTILGGDGVEQYIGFSQEVASELFACYGKRLPNKHEFSILANGSLTGHAYGSDPVVTLFDNNSRSLIGCEQVSGHMLQWGADMWANGLGAGPGYEWDDLGLLGKGGIYSYNANNTGVGAVLLGGYWNNAGFAGSEASLWGDEPFNNREDYSARAVCDHYQNL